MGRDQQQPPSLAQHMPFWLLAWLWQQQLQSHLAGGSLVQLKPGCGPPEQGHHALLAALLDVPLQREAALQVLVVLQHAAESAVCVTAVDCVRPSALQTLRRRTGWLVAAQLCWPAYRTCPDSTVQVQQVKRDRERPIIQGHCTTLLQGSEAVVQICCCGNRARQAVVNGGSIAKQVVRSHLATLSDSSRKY